MKKRISLALVVPMLGALGAAHAQAPVTPEFVMANNDLNKDGIITREEAMKAGRQLAQAWDFFDTNKDGKVDMDELKKGLAAAQESGAPPPAAATSASPQPAKASDAGKAPAVAKAGPDTKAAAAQPAPAAK